MADMKIAMTLTMADLASPEIQKFKANLAQLETYLKGLGDSFKVAIGGAADLGQAAVDTASGIAKVTKASADMGLSASRSSGSLSGLAKTLMQAETETAALWQSSMIMNKEALKSAFTFIKAADAATEYDASVTPLGATLARVAAETQAAIASTLEMNQAQLKAIFTYQKAEAAATEYDASVTRIGATLQAVAAQTQEMIAATMTMDKTMLSAAFAATGLGDKSLIAASKITDMGDAAAAADSKLAGMHGTMKGLVELYGAWKIGEGMKSSVEQAAQYQNKRVQLQNLNLPKSETSNILQNARQWSKIPGVSKLNSMEAAMAGVTGAPGGNPYQQNVRQAIMPMALQAAVALKTTYGDKNSVHDILKNLMGIVEMRGKLQNVAAAMKAIQTAFRSAVGSDLKVGLSAQETGLRNTGYGLAMKQSTWSTLVTNSLTEQFKSSGSGGGGGGSGGNTKAATIITMVGASALGGKMQKAQAIMLEQAGLLAPKDVRKIPGSSMTFVKPQSIVGSTEAQTFALGWVRNVLVPHFTALTHKLYPSLKGKSFTSMLDDELAAYAKTAGGVNVGTGLQTIADSHQWQSVMQRAHMMQHSASIPQAIGNASNKVTMQMRELHAAMGTLAVQIGTVLLPPMQMLAKWATDAAGAIRSLNAQMPVFKTIEAWAGALAAVLLGIKGIEWLMGIRQGFLALKAVNLGGTMIKWAATAVLGEDAVAGLATGLGGLGAVIAGLAAPITLAVVAIGAFGYAAYSMRHQLESGWAEFKHYLHPNAYPLPAHGAALGLGLMPGATHWGGAPVQNTSLQAMQARAAARAAGVNPAGLGYTGPVTVQGIAKAAQMAAKQHGIAAHHSMLASNVHQKALDHLYAIADKAAAKADTIAAKMNAAAVKMHLAFLAMTHPLGAKIAGVNLKYGAISSQMTASGHPGAASQALAIGHHQVLQYQYQGAMNHLTALKGNLHQNLTNTAALVTAGSLTKMQAAQQTIQMQKQAAPAMIQAANAAMKYAQALGDPKLVQALQMQKAHLQAMGKQLGYYAASIKNTMQGAFTGLFQNMMHGQKTWGQMFYSFFASIGKGIENILAKSISQSITTSLFGKKANQGIGSLIGGMAHFVGSLLGGSGGGSSNAFSGAGIMGAGSFSKSGGASTMSSVGGWIKAITSIAGMFGFASGANNIPNDMVANIHKGEMIIPAHGANLIRSGQASIGGAPGGNHVHLTIHAMDSQSVISALHNVRHEATQLFLNTATHMNMNGG